MLISILRILAEITLELPGRRRNLSTHIRAFGAFHACLVGFDHYRFHFKFFPLHCPPLIVPRKAVPSATNVQRTPSICQYLRKVRRTGQISNSNSCSNSIHPRYHISEPCGSNTCWRQSDSKNQSDRFNTNAPSNI